MHEGRFASVMTALRALENRRATASSRPVPPSAGRKLRYASFTAAGLAMQMRWWLCGGR